MNPIRNIQKIFSIIISNGRGKILLLALILLGFAPHVFADGFVPLAPIPGLTKDLGAVVGPDTLATFFNNLYKYLIGIAATLAVIEIIWGGIEISTKDSVSQHSDGKERIQQAIFGLVLVLSPVLVFSIINPSILNLSLNLPPINLITTPQSTVATSSLPGGGTSYAPNSGSGATGATVGSWCFTATTLGGNFGPTSSFMCYPDKTGCDTYLAGVKAKPSDYAFSVDGGAACIQQVSPP